MAKYEPTTKDNKCIFCEIVKGNIPSCVFWESETHMAFLAIDPNTEGFSVVIPKEHFDSDPLLLEDKDLSELIVASKKAGKILENYFSDVGRVGFIIEGMGINHIHTKLFPMHGTEHLKGGKWEQFLSSHKDPPWIEKYDGYITSIGGKMADPKHLQELSEKIKNSYK